VKARRADPLRLCVDGDGAPPDANVAKEPVEPSTCARSWRILLPDEPISGDGVKRVLVLGAQQRRKIDSPLRTG
jgi:hypothetical protein